MAETEAMIGMGTQLQYGDNADPVVFTTVAEVTNLTGPGMSRETPDATHMQSPDGYREFLGGLKDGGEVGIEANHVPTNLTQTELLALFESGERRPWRIVWPTTPPTIWEFKAVVTNFEPDTPMDDKMTLSSTLKVSGKPAFTQP